MKERIKKIMDSENMTPARFADTLQIGRAVISHILNGRNNPSLEVITKILNHMPYINAEWLLTGIEPMYKIEQENSNTKNSTTDFSTLPDLFTQLTHENPVNTSNDSDINEYRKDNIVEKNVNITQEPVNERIIYKEAPIKKIKQIIIYYTDNTFETFSGG
jgi:transcriptional regulator with XRE-family HTH domain